MNKKLKIEVVDNQGAFPYLKLTGLYTETEKKTIRKELEVLISSPGAEIAPGGGRYADGSLLSSNKGGFINEMYTNKIFSSTWSLVEYKVLSTLETMKEHESTPWFFKGIRKEIRGILGSYYTDNSYYKPHRDNDSISAVSWFFRTPKKFEGGDLSFPEYDITIPCAEDTTIFFPSNVLHSVSNIKMLKGSDVLKDGRYCVITFLKDLDRVEDI